jgi:transcriptional regulator with XRE-family HTH domain
MAEAEQDYGHATTVGERLRLAREAKGLTLEDVASQTRIPIRHLRSIEDSNWQELPAVTYTVGFGRSYAQAVGLDGAEVGRELREQLGGGTRPNQLSAEYFDPPDPARVPSRSLAWIAGILLIALVAGYLYWRSQLDDGDDAQQPAIEQQAEQQPQQVGPPQPAAPQNLTGQQVTLVAVQPVWFRITDRNGNRRIAERTLQAGEQYPVPLDLAQPIIRTAEPQNVRVMIAGQDRGLLSAERRQLRDTSLLANDLAAAGGRQPQAGPGTPPTR